MINKKMENKMKFTCDPEWIKCSDRMPENEEHVIAFIPSNCEGSKIEILLFDVFTNRWEGENYYTRYEISHWMPLPNKPKD